jgi:hypothetical protein
MLTSLNLIGNSYAKPSVALGGGKDADDEQPLFTVVDAEDFESDSPVVASGREEGTREVGGEGRRGMNTSR